MAEIVDRVSLAAPRPTFVDQVLNNRRYQYWALQTLGWGGYLFFLIVSAWLYEKTTPILVIYALMATVTGVLLSNIMHRSFKLIWDRRPIQRGLLTLLTVGLATGLWAFWKFYVAYQIYMTSHEENVILDYVYWYTYSFFILLSWTGLYYGIKYYQMSQEEHEKGLRIAAMAHQAQLKMLRYQLNPHFLFNTLNAISTLIMDNNAGTANRMVTELSRFLRYSLDNDPMQKVSLTQEVEAMKLYLDIEKIRFEERLELSFDVEPDARRALIPSLLLQPLVENAIKHAIAKREAGGKISFNARVFAGDLLLELSDDGPGIPGAVEMPGAPTGVGLTNTRERLEVHYGANHSCRFSNVSPHGLRVSIRIPYETFQS